MSNGETAGAAVAAGPGGARRVARRLFGGLAGSYDRTVDLATLYQDRRWKKWVLERLPREGLVLDVGCGTLLLEERANAEGLRFVGVDLSHEMVRFASAKGQGRVSLVAEGDAETLPFSGGSFDAVVSCYVVKYVDVRRLATELSRVCRPGGQVLMYDFARPSGPFGPLLGLYVKGGLRLVGYAARLARRSSAFTFENLPWIVDESTWHLSIREAMEANGFRTVRMTRMTGGTVWAYHGVRNGMPKSGAESS